MSKTPLVKTTRLPAERASRTNAASASASSIFEFQVAGEAPGVLRTIDPDVLRARLHAERIQQAMVVVREAVLLVHTDVELVRPLHEIEGVDREHRFRVAAE